MQGWSWMAALTLVAASTGAFAPSATAAEPIPVKQKVKLVLRLDGVVARAGTEITVKPGNPGCRFKTVTKPVDEHDFVELIDVETVNADRDCSFSITIKEPGQPDKTIRRSIQVEAGTADKPAGTQTYFCLLTSKSVTGARPVIATGKAEDTKQKK